MRKKIGTLSLRMFSPLPLPLYWLESFWWTYLPFGLTFYFVGTIPRLALFLCRVPMVAQCHLSSTFDLHLLIALIYLDQPFLLFVPKLTAISNLSSQTG